MSNHRKGIKSDLSKSRVSLHRQESFCNYNLQYIQCHSVTRFRKFEHLDQCFEEPGFEKPWGTNSFRISDDVNVFIHTDVSSEDSRSVYLQQTQGNGTIHPQMSLFPPLHWQWCLLVQTEDPRLILQEWSNGKHLAAHSSLKDRSYMSKSIRQSQAGEAPGFGFACPFKQCLVLTLQTVVNGLRDWLCSPLSFNYTSVQNCKHTHK